ncbi:hypothetical protein [Pseudonocardia asaccharolytica]|uniref:DAGKc domain-containing protein n=1 Tax=Pseudonocardia asaccharolytica DSM 44247 = NBRC 16224 TaxID=1123024 RepID=A0A511D1K9_9PSEU|nr:hypothetical protein [Pseudonocardia asaccharolytica]GEL18413.1 hypothetical protein PA7_22500 [Pseudonocardia asaccharolytica DSM 44247 = NBRC 16224]
MSSIDSDVVLLTCDGGAAERRRGIPAGGATRIPAVLANVPAVQVPANPGRAEIDPVLAEYRPARLIVAGRDADLSAVLVRLLRTERLGTTEVAYVPTSRRSAAAQVWELPRDPARAAALALDGTASAVPLIRDDAGGVLVGRGEVRGLRGEAYCDERLVLRGSVRRLHVEAGPRGVSALPGRGVQAATGRALQVGCISATVVHDGVPHPREVTRWTWYRHTSDWLLVKPPL